MFALHATAGAASHIWREWSWNAGIVLPMLAGAVAYARGNWILVSRREQQESRGARIRIRRTAAFVVGWLTLAIALVSPLHALSEQLFSAHMVQHELLMTLAAPLLVAGRPLVPILWAAPPKWRKLAGRAFRSTFVRTIWRALSRPFIAWLLYAVALWSWHAAVPFQFALRDPAVHALEHICFLFASLLFWEAMLQHRPRSHRGTAVLYLFTTAVHTSILGALITFDSALWYPLYADRTAALGVSPLHDQQFAGLIMWIPGAVPYLIAAIFLIVEWMRQSGASRWTAPSLPRRLVPDA